MAQELQARPWPCDAVAFRALREDCAAMFALGVQGLADGAFQLAASMTLKAWVFMIFSNNGIASEINA